MHEPTAEQLHGEHGGDLTDWQDAYRALGQRPDWPAVARWLVDTGPAMWPTVGQSLRSSGRRLDVPDPRLNGEGLSLWQTGRLGLAAARTLLRVVRDRVRGDHREDER